MSQRMIRWGVILLLVLRLPGAVLAAEAKPRVLVLDIELFDTSGEGEAPAHKERLERAGNLLRELLRETGRLDVLDPSALGNVGELPRIRTCNGCEVDLARQIGADFVVTGVVHKVSTLILSITLEVRDAHTGESALVASADIRGDNDRSWLRGITWLVRHRLLRT